MATFTVTIEGQPPSVNHSYRPIKKPMRDSFGQPIYSEEGRQVVRIGLAKNQKVTDYQQLVVWRTQAAKPSGWRHAGGWIHISYQFYLTRKMDCDNAMKALNDAMAMALGVDDFWFLPCVISKSVNSKEPARVVVTIREPSESLSSPPTP
jgi:Holliday junction resolvase RusA-like endonuclease